MSLMVARWMLGIAGTYLGLGVLFAGAFLTVGIARIDPGGSAASPGLRLLLFPGVVALWPLLAGRWLAGTSHPPVPRDAHRRAAVGDPS